MDRTENDAANISVVACIRCHGNVLPSNDRDDTNTDKELWEVFMNYIVEMGSLAMI
jgi:hypothetical protein